MKDQAARDEVASRVPDVEPTLSGGCYTEADYISNYVAPYRSRKLYQIEAHENKRNMIFCRACMKKDGKGFLVAYRLYCELEDNLLENKKDAWIKLQCQHCDFEMVTDKPSRKPPGVDSEQLRRMQELMAQQDLQARGGLLGQGIPQLGSGQLGGQSAAQQRLWVEHEEQRRRAAMASQPPVQNPTIGPSYSKKNWRSGS